jgi:hypothetical protein
LINGNVDYLYKFPTIVVRYRLKDSEGFAEKGVVAEPIFIASRLPADVSGLELRPLKGKVEDESRKYMPWMLWALGGILAALGVANLAWRTIPQWKEMAKQRRKAESGDVLVQAYGSLSRNVAMGVAPKHLIHQMDLILRIVLARKEKADWLEEPDLDGVSSGIRPSVISLFEKLERNHATQEAEQKEVQEASRQLEEILRFYFGAKQVESWRSYASFSPPANLPPLNTFGSAPRLYCS